MPATNATRPGWDAYFIEFAKVAALRAACTRRRNGAVLVQHQSIIATGYNGTTRGAPNCTEQEQGCARCASDIPSGVALDACVCEHAEANAILQAARLGLAAEGGTLYTLLSPCVWCAKMIVQAGIKRVVYRDVYPSEVAEGLLQAGGVTIEQIGT